LTSALATVPCSACGRALSLETEGLAWCSCGKASRVWRFRPVREAARPPAPVLAGTPCAYHAGNAASTTCLRCGSFVCNLCATPVGGSTYCTACFERLHASGELRELRVRIPRPQSWALALSLIAMVPYVALVAAPIVVWLGVRAIRNRHETTAREDGLFAYLAIAGLLTTLGLVLTGILLFELVTGPGGRP